MASCSSSSSTPAAPTASTKPTTVHYDAVYCPGTFVSATGQPLTPPFTPAAGDRFDSRATLYSGNRTSHSNTVAATFHTACIFTSTRLGTCEGQIAIGNSMLLAQHATVDFGPTTNTIPLTGGTGQYQGIHGQLTYTLVGNTADITVTFSK